MRLILICVNNNKRYLTMSITDTNKYQPLEMRFIDTLNTIQFTMFYDDYLKHIELFSGLNITSETTIPHYDIFVENTYVKLFELHADIDLYLGDILKNTKIKYNRECRLNDLFKDELRDTKLNYLLP